MTGTRTLIHLISVALLLLWSAVLLYFYATGRVQYYLPGDGLFRPMVLVSGIGLSIVALFNLLTMNSEDAGCEGHDHGHADCGHDHTHDHAHSHQHEVKNGCCGHDHHDHAHGHNHTQDEHGHGILEESGWTGRIIALLILAAPITWATFQSPDRFSSVAVMNKGLYNPNYASTTRADEFTLRGDGKAPLPTPTPPPDMPAIASNPPQTPAQSQGAFTLEDLKQQVPQNSKGEFILDVPEIYYTGGDVEVQNAITGQAIETTAQVLPEKVDNADGHRLRIFRMLIQCCAADARPYSIPIDFGKQAPAFKDMTWVRVSGVMSYEKSGDQTVPVVKVTNIEETTAPENAMMY